MENKYMTATDATFVSTNGKTVSFQPLFEGAHKYMLGARAKGLVSEADVDDLTQDAAVRIILSSGRFDETRLKGSTDGASYGGWIARNVRISDWQKSERRPKSFSDTLLTDKDGREFETSSIAGYRGNEYEADREVCQSEALRFIWGRIDSLSDKDRQVAVMMIDGLKPKKIAEALGCTPDAASIRIYKIRKFLGGELRSLLEEYGMGVGNRRHCNSCRA